MSTTAVKFLDLHAVNERFRTDIDAAIRTVLDSGWYLRGAANDAFCAEFAAYCGASHCLGVANGLDALNLIIRAWGFGPGDEIIVPANTFIASLLAVSQNGCTPVPVDAQADTCNIDPALIEAAISPRTRAIMVVHLYGQAVDMAPITALAEKYSLKIIEDAAQAHGAYYNGKRTGNLGHAAAFSFYPGKNLGCLGDGGAIVTSDSALFEQARTLATYGEAAKYVNPVKGVNSRLDELQAAILSVKLPHLDADNTIRRAIAHRYLAEISNPRITLPVARTDEGHVWHIFAIRTAQRDQLQAYLAQHGIQTQIHYPVPPHRQKAYSELAHLAFPVAEGIHHTTLSLPISPVMSEQEIRTVIRAVNAYGG